MKPKVDGYKAHCWLATHSEESDKYSGQWVAVGENGILAASYSFKDLMAQVDRLPVFMPLITKIPTEEETLYILSANAA